MKKMKSVLKILAGTLLIQVLIIGTSCGQEHRGSEKGGEEDGTQFTKEQTYNEVKKGVKLVLKYDEASSQFVGVITNKSKKVVERARMEVHLSNGVELGPTKPVNLKPGAETKVSLSAKGQKFTTWSTHAEVGSNEHGHGEGGEGHEGGEKGEHGSKKEGKEEHGSKEGRGEHK